jgi:hypothetical protein
MGIYLLAEDIATGEALGAPALRLILAAAGIASGATFGATQQLARTLPTASAPSAEGFGAAHMGLYLVATGKCLEPRSSICA